MTRTRPKHHPFVMVTYNVLDSAAWKAMSTGARCLYIALKRHYRTDTQNNGKIFLSQRDAMKALGRHDPNQIARWFRELQFYGFIVMTEAGALGVDGKGRAPHWRLTELPLLARAGCRCGHRAAIHDRPGHSVRRATSSDHRPRPADCDLIVRCSCLIPPVLMRRP